MEAAVNGEIDLFCLDQSGFGRTPYVPYAWQDRGGTMAVPCREGKRINVMGMYSLMRGTLQAEITDKNITSDKDIGVLGGFSKTVTRFTVAVLDNASIHTANVIEMVWRKIKYEWLPLSAFESFKRLWNNLHDLIQKIGLKYNIYFA